MFPENVAAASLLFITFGDMLAAIVGRYGRHRVFKYKTAEGFLAELLANLVVGYLFVGLVGILMAIIATLVEFFSFRADDNLLVPLLSGSTGALLLWILR